MEDNERSLLILSAADKAIRPLIRWLILWGIGYKDFSEYLKTAYLEEARSHLISEKKSITASVLSLVAGIHRKETSAFLKQTMSYNSDRDLAIKPSAAFTVFSAWTTQKQYQTTHGFPISLKYSLENKNEPSFSKLCSEITTDIRPKTILDELLRLDLVEMNSDVITLKKDAYIPSQDLKDKLLFFHRNISEHIAASTSNLSEHSPALFERMASHGQLTERDVDALKDYVSVKGMELLKDVYRQAESLASKNINIQSSNNKLRFSFGMYFNKASDNPEDQNE